MGTRRPEGSSACRSKRFFHANRRCKKVCQTSRQIRARRCRGALQRVPARNQVTSSRERTLLPRFAQIEIVSQITWHKKGAEKEIAPRGRIQSTRNRAQMAAPLGGSARL